MMPPLTIRHLGVDRALNGYDEMTGRLRPNTDGSLIYSCIPSKYLGAPVELHPLSNSRGENTPKTPHAGLHKNNEIRDDDCSSEKLTTHS